jgi:methyl-accepting chemotaxis protein
MRHIPIVGKFLAIMAAFGVFSIAVALFAGFQISTIDTSYSRLLEQESSAALNIVRTNRSLQSARAAISEIIMSRTDALTQAASTDFAQARQSFDTASNQAVQAAPGDADIARMKADGEKLLDVTCKPAIAMGLEAKADATVASAQQEFLTHCQPAFKSLSEQFSSKSKGLTESADLRSDALTEISNATALTTVALVIGGLVIVASGGFFAIRSWLVRPIGVLAAAMGRLADGALSTDVAGTDRKDEIGVMARAVQVFKDNGLRAKALESEAEAQRNTSEAERRRTAEADRARAAEMAEATMGLADGLKHLSDGDLAYRLDQPFAPDFEGLRADFNAAIRQLSDTLSSVAQSTSQIDGGTREISQSAEDLSKRTEQQASSLEETAAALDQITANVTSSSKRAEEARSVAKEARSSATASAAVVANAVHAMQRIEQSSDQIANIISVIDEIAFQTNLLALNAGVEAARAGEAGKGFAVVAQEVRELAQRSAQAAKEIKGLIQNSTTEVESGVKLVSETGTALKAIEGYILAINDHMEAIATSAREQSVGLSEVNTAVNQMDQVTQQNAAMVEESTAASATLASEAARLRSLVGQFKLGIGGATRTSAPRPVSAASQTIRVASPARAMTGQLARAFGSSAAAVSEQEWQEF